MIDFQEEKGLFTFYREQAEQQKLIKQKKRLLKKRKLHPKITECHQNQKQCFQSANSVTLPIQIKNQSNQQLSKAKVKNKPKKTAKNTNNDCSVIIIDSGDHYHLHSKCIKQQKQKKPLSLLVFDPKFERASKNGFPIQKNQIREKDKSKFENKSKYKSKINLQEFNQNHFTIFNDRCLINDSMHQGNHANISSSLRNKGIFGKYNGIQVSLQAKQYTQDIRELPQIRERKRGVDQNFESSRASQKRSRLDKHYFQAYSKIRKIQHPQQYQINKKNRSFIGGVIGINEQNNRSHIIAPKCQGLSTNQNQKLLELLKKIKITQK